MLKPITVPTLSVKGRIGAIAEKTDTLIAHFFASDVHQSYLFKGAITNLQNMIQERMHDIAGLKEDLRNGLEQYLRRYYDMALVEVGDDAATNLSSRISLYISIEVTQEDQQYSVANQLTLMDGKFEKITKLNNTGSIN